MKFLTLASVATLAISTQAADAVDWSGTWKISTTATSCCWPKDHVVVYQKDGLATTTGVWDDTKACQDLAINGRKWISRDQKVDEATKLGLVFGLGNTIMTAALIKEGDNAKYQNLAQPNCAATFTKDTGAAAPTAPNTKVENWAGQWKIKPADGTADKCCWPKDVVTVTQEKDVAFAKITWDGSKVCETMGLNGKTIDSPKQVLDPDNNLLLFFSLGGTNQIATLSKNGETATYNNIAQPACKATFDFVKGSESTGSGNGNGNGNGNGSGNGNGNGSGNGNGNGNGSGSDKEKDDKKKKIIIAVVVVVIILILLVVAFFLYKRYQANKLREQFRGGYSNDSLLRH